MCSFVLVYPKVGRNPVEVTQCPPYLTLQVFLIQRSAEWQ
jgi:hypothetical protein